MYAGKTVGTQQANLESTWILEKLKLKPTFLERFIYMEIPRNIRLTGHMNAQDEILELWFRGHVFLPVQFNTNNQTVPAH